MSPQLCTLALMAVLTLLLIIYVAARARKCRAETFTTGDAPPDSSPRTTDRCEADADDFCAARRLAEAVAGLSPLRDVDDFVAMPAPDE